jgi:hypothetical protein
MAEVDKVMEEAVVETPQTEEIDIELESENVTATSEEVAAVSDEFYKNIALDLSEDSFTKHFQRTCRRIQKR